MTIAEPGRTSSCTLVLFGASGDLAQRMVMPAVFRLARQGLLPPEFDVIGYARTPLTDGGFRSRMRDAVLAQPRPGDEAAWPAFARRLSYVAGDYAGDDGGFAALSGRLDEIDRRIEASAGSGRRRLFYLATPPALFATILVRLSEHGLAGRGYQAAGDGWARVVIEKPFGHDLASARALNATIGGLFDEADIYRIDHFLGKEIVQSLFALRFANGIFEPVWNRNYIDHVQITAAETLGVEGRAGYYEQAGAMRDMVQNHLLQACALVALEPPAEWSARAVRDEKAKVLRAVARLPPADAVRGQYAGGHIRGSRVPAYRDENKVAADSMVETFAAVRLQIENVRWAGVPFYLRSGKRLAVRSTEIVVEFKPAPHTPFAMSSGQGMRPNRLIATVSPHEGVVLEVVGKHPGQEMHLQPIDLPYCYSRGAEPGASPTAYERLLLDALRGDPTFFARADEVESAWGIVEPVIQQWERERAPDFPNYAAGSMGPPAADELMRRDGRRWRPFTPGPVAQTSAAPRE